MALDRPPPPVADAPLQLLDVVVGYEAGAAPCVRAAEVLGDVLAQEDPRRAAFHARTPLLGAHTPVDAWLAAAVDVTARRARWSGVEPDLVPVALEARGGGRHGVGAVLVLDAAHLTDDAARRTLAATLASAPRDVVETLVVAIDATGAALPADAEVAAARVAAWLADLAPREGETRTVVLASAVLDDGRPVLPDEIAEAVACALAGELARAPDAGNALLLAVAQAPALRLGVLGARAVRFSPRAVASRLLPRTLAALLERTTFAPDPSEAVPPPDVPPSPKTFVRDLLPAGKADAPHLVLLDKAGAGDVAGREFAVHAELGSVRTSVELDRAPPSDWRAGVFIWDHVLRRGRLPVWLERVERAADRVLATARDRLRATAASAVGDDGADPRARQVAKALRRRVEERYAVEVDVGAVPSLSDDLRRVERAVAAIPHAASAAVRGLVGGAALLVPAVWVLLDRPSLFSALWAGTIAVVGAVVAAFGLGAPRAARSAARAVREDALAGCEDRARAEIALAVRAALVRLREVLRGEAARAETTVGAILDALAPLRAAPRPPPAPPRAGLVEDLPDDDALADVWREQVLADLERGPASALRTGFVGFLRDFAARALAGATDAPAGVAGERARDVVGGALAARIAQAMRLWQFLRPRGAAGAPDPARVREVLLSLCPDEGRVFAPGAALGAAALGAATRRELVRVPRAILGVADVPGFAVAPSGVEALVTRTTVVWMGVQRGGRP